MDRLTENRDRILERIASACRKAGRDPGSVRVIAVTKSADLASVRALIGRGQRDLAENRVQALEERAAALPEGPTWHLIGSLQTNKVRKAVRRAAWIHSLDRPELAEAIARAGEAGGLRPRLLLEVNASGEAAKHGVAPPAAAALLEEIRERHPGLTVDGLMTMAPIAEDPERVRPVFARLRALRDELRRRTGLPLPELSMGMTQDYAVAVEEGATMVRIGRAFFEGVSCPG